jgi:nitrogen fixation protein FixH
MTRPFTGRHMAAALVGFFAVVIAVNLVMATQAVRTFGGVVVANSYVASQRFNGWLAEARAQERQGYRAEAHGTPGGTLTVRLRGPGGPRTGAGVTVQAEHPLGRIAGRDFALREVAAGQYVAPHALPPGRWKLRIRSRGKGADAQFEQEVRL